ncbi:hypothetical protein NL676_021072 [Syzygium grande]|nr:hypothetical protein NL676_021072 [Syzygium grande]
MDTASEGLSSSAAGQSCQGLEKKPSILGDSSLATRYWGMFAEGPRSLVRTWGPKLTHGGLGCSYKFVGPVALGAHSCIPKGEPGTQESILVHMDIKSSNSLLDSNMQAKTVNFSLVKLGYNTVTMHLREVMDEEGRVMWAAATEAFEGHSNKEIRKAKRLRRWMDDGLVADSSCSVESITSMVSIAVSCLNRDLSRRPSMVDIMYTLCKSEDIFYISEDGLSANAQGLAR